MKRYRVNEIFYSLQGEGARAGTANVFVRFSGCNLACDLDEGPRSPGGFMCDTEFVSGRDMTAEEIVAAAIELEAEPAGVIFTGGEPGLQLDVPLIDEFRTAGIIGNFLCIETNGTVDVSNIGLDWISCSPKVAEHALKIREADEVRYVTRHGLSLPRPAIKARHRYLSPAWDAHGLSRANLDWAINLCKDNPDWALSMQQHKIWRIR